MATTKTQDKVEEKTPEKPEVKKQDKTEQKKPALSITSRPDSFRRAGYVFTQEPTIIPMDELSDEQVEQLKSESKLVVSETTV